MLDLIIRSFGGFGSFHEYSDVLHDPSIEVILCDFMHWFYGVVFLSKVFCLSRSIDNIVC